MTTATEDGRRLFAVGVDRDTGRIVHDVKVFDVQTLLHVAPVNSYASPTPVVEAGRVYVHFGTYGTACLDTKTGEVLWTRRDLTCDHHEGPGSAPILFEKLLLFDVDGCDVQYVIALDKETGKTVWKTKRSADYGGVSPFERKAFRTPTIFEAEGRLQMVCTASKAAIAYDPRTGEELWNLPYRGWSVTPRPIFRDRLLYLIIDYEKPEHWAVKVGGKGDLPESAVAWKIPSGMPQKPSLLLVGDMIYLVNESGVAMGIEAKTGQVVWKQPIGGEHSASPVFADGRLYFFNHNAVATVMEPGREAKVLATNRLDGKMMAWPAAAGQAIYLRTDTHLYRIEKREAKPN